MRIVVGGGVPDAPRRGQDPSLRCKPLKGIQWQGCGPGMPGPYGLLCKFTHERGKGGRQPAPTVGGKFAAKDVGSCVPDAPRRGQDPSLRCKPVKGIQWQGCGPGMPGPYGLLFPAAGVRGRLAAHNERRQFATQTRSCGCLPRRGKHCSLPSFAALNCGPTLATPQHPSSKTEQRARALRTKSNTAFV